jgi:hypothetical protein
MPDTVSAAVVVCSNSCPLVQAFDEAVRGMAIGDTVRIKVSRRDRVPFVVEGKDILKEKDAERYFLSRFSQAEGGPWREDLLFRVPRDHQEVQRLEGRYKKWAAVSFPIIKSFLRHCITHMRDDAWLFACFYLSNRAIPAFLSTHRSSGGVQVGQIVELSNGSMAVVVRCEEETVFLDANNVLAGKSLAFELELMGLEREE